MKLLLRRTLVLKNSYEPLYFAYSPQLMARSLLNPNPNVPVCDARGDAQRTNAGFKKNWLHSSLSIEQLTLK